MTRTWRPENEHHRLYYYSLRDTEGNCPQHCLIHAKRAQELNICHTSPTALQCPLSPQEAELLKIPAFRVLSCRVLMNYFNTFLQMHAAASFCLRKYVASHS